MFDTLYDDSRHRICELAVSLTAQNGAALTHWLSGAFFLVSMYFVWRSFYGMRIRSGETGATSTEPAYQAR